MKIVTVICKARSMTRQIPLDYCVPNPAHPACKLCNSPNIAQLKPEEQARLRNQDSSDGNDDEELFDDLPGIEPDEEDFEELEEE